MDKIKKKVYLFELLEQNTNHDLLHDVDQFTQALRRLLLSHLTKTIDPRFFRSPLSVEYYRTL